MIEKDYKQLASDEKDLVSRLIKILNTKKPDILYNLDSSELEIFRKELAEVKNLLSGTLAGCKFDLEAIQCRKYFDDKIKNLECKYVKYEYGEVSTSYMKVSKNGIFPSCNSEGEDTVFISGRLVITKYHRQIVNDKGKLVYDLFQGYGNFSQIEEHDQWEIKIENLISGVESLTEITEEEFKQVWEENDKFNNALKEAMFNHK